MQKWARLLYQPALPLNGKVPVTGSEEHIGISKKAADESVVLLKNNGLLPLRNVEKVALLGKASYEYVKGGGGSGDVYCEYTRSLYDGLKMRGVKVYEPIIEYYKEELDKQYKKGCVPGMTKEPTVPSVILKNATRFSETAIVVINRFSGEGWDRSDIDGDIETFNPWPAGVKMTTLSKVIFPDGDFYLSFEEKELVQNACDIFDNVVVVLNIGGVMDCRWIEGNDRIDAAVYMGQGGMEGGLAAADVILGNICPSGRLADTFAGTLEDYPSTKGYHDSFDYVDYTEDIYVGYRFFETFEGASDRVIYPFGYGLSYTSFDIEVLGAVKKEDTIIFNVKVTNTGRMAGKEVMQLYVSAPSGKLLKPKKSLVDFEKTKELQPGESQLMTLKITEYGLSSYDDLGKFSDASYVLEKGKYEFYLGSNVRDAAKISFFWENFVDKVVCTLSHKVVPAALKKRLLGDGTYEELPVFEKPDKNESVIEKMEPGTEEALAPTEKGLKRHYYTMPLIEGAKKLSDVAEGKISLDEFMEQLSVNDMIELLGGQPNTGVANVFGFGNMEEYGIPNAMTADGPAGVRIMPETGIKTTAFPCATSIACTWNKEIAEEVGRAGGEELKENNLCVWLTPAINIHRNPMCGRNFEYYSEDPYLTGKMAAAMVRGIQKNHVGACVKHFACNNKEINRKHCDSRVSERALREIYLKPFEMIVKEEQPYTIMSSYNVVNGERASECRDLITGILREEWGYTGLVMSDWWTRGEHYKEINAGNDLKMATGFPERVKEALELGAVSEENIRISAKRVLKTLLKFD
ncbi:MAG: glycoside hydrolase family 3 C-terminal domain-containing protein [Butyrivibrio sp.]|nr:glycoside hydrolase family 3 C-terminal domain-containing protein [Butyrivibrio sp.]